MNKIYFTIGVPGSGKSILGHELKAKNPKTLIIERDIIRRFFGMETKGLLPFEEEKVVTKIEKQLMEIGIRKGYDVVVADTNLRLEWLEILIDKAIELGVEYEIHIIGEGLDEDELRRRNSEREDWDKVSDDVMNLQLEQFRELDRERVQYLRDKHKSVTKPSSGISPEQFKVIKNLIEHYEYETAIQICKGTGIEEGKLITPAWKRLAFSFETTILENEYVQKNAERFGYNIEEAWVYEGILRLSTLKEGYDFRTYILNAQPVFKYLLILLLGAFGDHPLNEFVKDGRAKPIDDVKPELQPLYRFIFTNPKLIDYPEYYKLLIKTKTADLNDEAVSKLEYISGVLGCLRNELAHELTAFTAKLAKEELEESGSSTDDTTLWQDKLLQNIKDLFEMVYNAKHPESNGEIRFDAYDIMNIDILSKIQKSDTP
jgi:predicted kinase